MPKIAQYDAPDNLGLRPTEVGINAVAGAARRLEADFRDAAQAKEQTGQRFGQDIALAGKIATDYIAHQEISTGAPAFAKLQEAKHKQWDDLLKDPKTDLNDPTIAPKFRESLETDLEKFKSAFLTEKGQQYAEQQVNHFRSQMFTKTSADMATLAGHAANVNYRQTVNALSNTVRSDPASMDAALKSLDDTIDALVSTSPNLRGEKAATLRAEMLQKGREEIIKSAALSHIEKTGEVPAWVTDKKYAPYINGAELKQLTQAAKYYQRLNKSEERSERLMVEQAQKRDFNDKINKLEMETIPANVGDHLTLPKDYWQKIRELSQHPGAAMEPGRLRSMVTYGEAITNRMGKPEPLGPVSHETTVDLMRRMRLPQGSPERIDSLDPVYQAYQDGKLNNADFNFVKREFLEARTPEGQRLSTATSDFMKAVTPQIDKSNPLMGKIDQDGKMQVYRFEMDLKRKIDEYRKAGKNPYDLFDPSKPDFVGRPEALAPYQKTLAESLRDTAQRLGAPPGTKVTPNGTIIPPLTPPPEKLQRKPGETAEQYLKRIGAN